jgi:hypothetical protein
MHVPNSQGLVAQVTQITEITCSEPVNASGDSALLKLLESLGLQCVQTRQGRRRLGFARVTQITQIMACFGTSQA